MSNEIINFISVVAEDYTTHKKQIKKIELGPLTALLSLGNISLLKREAGLLCVQCSCEFRSKPAVAEEKTDGKTQ